MKDTLKRELEILKRELEGDESPPRSKADANLLTKNLLLVIRAILDDSDHGEDEDEPSLRGWVFLDHRGELTPFWAGSDGLYTSTEEDGNPEMTWWEVEGGDWTLRPITAADLSVEAYTRDEFYEAYTNSMTWSQCEHYLRGHRGATS